MSQRSLIRDWGLAAVLLLLAACNLPNVAEPTPTSTLTLREIEALVGAALINEGQMTEAARPSDTPTPPKPSPTPTDTPTGSTETPTASPTNVPKCTVVSNFLNLRSGPGIVYDPPLRTVTSGTMLFPFARNADGSWLEGRQEGDSQTFWFSAAGQFVDCNLNPTSLSQGQIPPTRTPTNTSTPAPTLTPSPTDKPTPTNTPCPKFTNPFISASVNAGTNAVNLTWGSQGGCGGITGTITATYKVDGSPYKTHIIKGGSGKLTDQPSFRGCGSFDIIYVLTLKDSSGQTLTTSTSANVFWLC